MVQAQDATRASGELHWRAFRGISVITHIPILSIVSNSANILHKETPQKPTKQPNSRANHGLSAGFSFAQYCGCLTWLVEHTLRQYCFFLTTTYSPSFAKSAILLRRSHTHNPPRR